MISEVEAIVLSRIPYSESSYILNLYTKEQGRLAVFLRNGGKRPTAKTALLHPLALVHVQLSGTGQMPRVKNYEVSFPLNDLPFNPIKSSLAMFMAEMLSHVLKEKCGDEALFNFLTTNICILDTSVSNLSNYHLYFLLHLTRFLGFMPNVDGVGEYVDLQEGVLAIQPPFHSCYTDKNVTELWKKILLNDYQEVSSIPLSRDMRRETLENIVKYYQIQVQDIQTLKSLAVLQQLFD